MNNNGLIDSIINGPCGMELTQIDKRATFDEVVDTLRGEVINCQNAIERIQTALYGPGPCCDIPPSQKPRTITEAIGELVGDMQEQNKTLYRLAESLERHFGELKME